MIKISKRNISRPYEDTHKIIDGILHKLCSDCNEWLSMNENYYKNKSNKQDGLNPYCKECCKSRTTNWRKTNPEKKKKIDIVSYLKPRRKEQVKQAGKRRRESGKYREWQQNNPDRIKGYNKDRQMNKKHKISKQEWEECKKYFNYCCAYCGLPIEKHYIKFKGERILGDFHKEHVDDQGANDLSNCVPSCKICNTSKHDRNLEDWYNENNPNFSQQSLNKILRWLESDYKLYIKTNGNYTK